MIRIHSGSEVLSENRELFTKVEHRTQLINGSVTSSQFLYGGGGLQPRREQGFSPSRARGRQKLEERTSPENVQICGIRMMRIGETFPRFAAALPSVFQPRDASLVKLNCSAHTIGRSVRQGMPPNQNNE